MDKKYIISIFVLLLQIGLVTIREIWVFPKNVNLIISSIQVIASLIILLCVASHKTDGSSTGDGSVS